MENFIYVQKRKLFHCYSFKFKSNSELTKHQGTSSKLHTKAELLQECIFFVIHLFARDVLVMKKLKNEKTKPTFIISVLKVEY